MMFGNPVKLSPSAPQMQQATPQISSVSAPQQPAFQPINGGANFSPIGGQPSMPTPQWSPYRAPPQFSVNNGNNMAENAVHNFYDPMRHFGGNFNARNILDPGSIFGGGGNELRGKIDPTAGTVNVRGKGQKWDDAFTQYLRTGQGEPTGGHGAFSKLKKQIQALRNSGWQYGG